MKQVFRRGVVNAGWLLLILIVACGGSATPSGDDGGSRGPTSLTSPVVREGDLEYMARVDVMESFPVQIVGHVDIENVGLGNATATFPDGCVALFRVFPAGSTDGEAIWDQRFDVACTQALVPVELGAGESVTFDTPTVSAATILGEQHPDGEYTVVVYARPDGHEVALEAGTVDLAVPRN